MKIKVVLWKWLTRLYSRYLNWFYGMHIADNAVISWKARLDKSINPKGIYVGKNSWVLARVIILAHDHCRGLKADTIIGDNSVIGVAAIIMPGVRIGDQVIIGSGSVVTKDIPSHCIAVGNPAKVIKTGIKVYNGRIINE